MARQAADGTFGLQPSPLDTSPCSSSDDQRLEAIAVLDVDHDGYDDVLATVSLGGLGSPPVGLAVAHGSASGLGGFACVASSTVTTPGFPAALAGASLLATGDFDGDGTIDLVAVSYPDGVSTMQLYASHGAPDLRPAAGIALPPAGRLLVDHVAGRARDALLAVDVFSDHTDLSRYATDATGIGQAALVATLPAGHAPSAVEQLYGFALADFNGDQRTDVIAIGNQDGASGPTPFSITCDRGATWQGQLGMFPADTRVLRAIDLDSNGDSELVARVGADVVLFKLQ